jgi:hypothetical protein
MPDLIQDDYLRQIRDLLKELVQYAKIADIRGRVIADMWEGQEKLKQVERLNLSPEMVFKNAIFDTSRPYDWWRLENGAYAKVYKAILEGEVYQEDGKKLCVTTWNPLNMSCLQNDISKHWDLRNRKTGDNPAGWPDWCK